MIRCIEEYSINAWPALQTLHYDGWVLRFANGYTRRANSVHPLYPSTLPLDQKIAACEALYADRGLPPCFKMTAASQPHDLDEALAGRGYALDAPTSVQLLDLAALPLAGGAHDGVEITSTPGVEWLSAFNRFSAVTPERQAMHAQILAAIPPVTGYAAIRQEGRLVACGLGVAQTGCLGLFDIVTDAACRRQGHARRLVRALLDWGKRQGARTAYLQVMLNNAPALNLYAGLEFRECYTYWYRVKPLG